MDRVGIEKKGHAMFVLSFDSDSCLACGNCLLACSYKNTGEFNSSASNIRVNFFGQEKACITWTCRQCDEAECLKNCPAGAIRRNQQTGAVEIDPEVCAGCKLCLLSCPFGSIRFDKNTQICRKCDLCGGDPACVKVCISGALQFVDSTKIPYQRRELFSHVRCRKLGS